MDDLNAGCILLLGRSLRVGTRKQCEQQKSEHCGTVQLLASYVQQVMDGFVQSRTG